MADLIVMNGVTYVIPIPGDENWGQNVTDFLIAIPDAILQKTGGLFTLTADANFGTPFGLISTYFKSHTTGIATAGVLRLAKTDTIDWLNNAGSGNNVLSVDGTDRLTYNSVPIVLSLADGHIFVGNISNVPTDVAMTGDVTITDLGVTAIGAGKVGNTQVNSGANIAYTKLNLTGSITNTDIYSSAAIAYSKLALTGAILNADLAGSITYSKLVLTGDIVNADIATSAAIAYSKLAALTANRVLLSDGSGFVSASSITNTTLGYLDATSSIQTQINSKQATLTTGNLTETTSSVLTITGGTGAVIGSGTTILVKQASTSVSGFLSSADWTTFNSKQAAFSGLTTDGVIYATSATAVVSTAAGTTGQVLTATTSSAPSWAAPAAAAAGSLTGTTLNSAVVTSSLTTVGTIGTGVWQGTVITPTYGGTGLATLTAHAVLLGEGTSNVGFVGPSSNVGYVLTSTGATSDPTFQAVTGSGTVNSGTQYQLAYYAATGAAVSGLTLITANRALISDANGLPIASAVTNTVLGYLDATSSVQTQINAKQATLTAGQLPGTATNNDATAGNVGEYVTSAISVTNYPTSGQWGDLTSISLTAGDWDVRVSGEFENATAVTSYADLGLSITSGNSSTGLSLGDTYLELGTGVPTGSNVQFFPGPTVRFSLAGTTTVYMKARSGYSGGPPTLAARMAARRMR